jgi:cyanate permease
MVAVKAATWRLTAAATGLTALIAGSRASFGMFLSPLNTATGLGMASIALAAAFGQLAAGVALPVVEALARRFGPARVIAGGACLLALSTALLVLVHTLLALVFLMLVVFATGTAVASNALLIGEVSRRTAPAERGVATGVIGAGGPAGQLLLAPLVTFAIALQGWVAALCALGAIALLALPLARAFAHRPTSRPTATAILSGNGEALRDPRFWLIAGSFATCGFHVAFLTVHMPGVIERCGLPATFTGVWLVIAGAANMAGSIGVGILMKRFSSAPLLALVYGMRVLAIAAFVVAPPGGAALLGFALAMGATYMATLPPTAELLARAFGIERLSSLLGMTMLVHQVGGFFGAWLGGVAVEHRGSYTPLWIGDIALAAVAAALQFALMRERRAPPSVPPAMPRARWACAAAPGRLSG